MRTAATNRAFVSKNLNPIRNASSLDLSREISLWRQLIADYRLVGGVREEQTRCIR